MSSYELTFSGTSETSVPLNLPDPLEVTGPITFLTGKPLKTVGGEYRNSRGGMTSLDVDLFDEERQRLKDIASCTIICKSSEFVRAEVVRLSGETETYLVRKMSVELGKMVPNIEPESEPESQPDA